MKNKKFLIFIIFIFIFAFQTLSVQAEVGPNPAAGTEYGLTATAKEATLTDSGDSARPQDIIAKIVGYLLAMIGIVFLVQIVFAGYSWMMSGGSDEKIKKAKDKITSSAIGLAVVLLAYIISWAIFDLLYKVL